MKVSVLLLCFAMLFPCTVLFAQTGHSSSSEDAWRDNLKREAHHYTELEGPTSKRNVTGIETLFDGEHLKPFETPYNIHDPNYTYTFKENALLGSWSVEARGASLLSISDGNDADGYSAFGRVRFGPLGADITYSDFDPGRNLKSLMSARALVDFDIYQWLTVRVAFGYADVQLENAEDTGVTFGGELELYPFKPFSLEVHHSEYATNNIETIKDSFVGVGFFPLFLSEDDFNYPTLVPEIRIGWRRIVGNRTTTNSNYLVLEAAIEF